MRGEVGARDGSRLAKRKKSHPKSISPVCRDLDDCLPVSAFFFFDRGGFAGANGGEIWARAHLVHLGRKLVDEPHELFRLSHVQREPAQVQEPPREGVAGAVPLEPRALRAGRATAAFPALVGAQGGESAAARSANVGHTREARGALTATEELGRLSRWNRRARDAPLCRARQRSAAGVKFFPVFNAAWTAYLSSPAKNGAQAHRSQPQAGSGRFFPNRRRKLTKENAPRW